MKSRKLLFTQNMRTQPNMVEVVRQIHQTRLQVIVSMFWKVWRMWIRVIFTKVCFRIAITIFFYYGNIFLIKHHLSSIFLLYFIYYSEWWTKHLHPSAKLSMFNRRIRINGRWSPRDNWPDYWLWMLYHDKGTKTVLLYYSTLNCFYCFSLVAFFYLGHTKAFSLSSPPACSMRVYRVWAYFETSCFVQTYHP